MLSILVAFRDADGHRTRLWDFIRQHLERALPDAEIVVGTDDGADPFHKTLALNRAAAAASGDVFMVADSDTWVPPSRIRAAEAGIATTPTEWWRPWNLKLKLAPDPTERVLALGPDWDGTAPVGARLENQNRYWASPPVMFHRAVWEEVGGMDERFRGWGHEDEAFCCSVRALFGEQVVIPARSVHLWHPRIGRSGNDLWPGQDSSEDNHKLAVRYRMARQPEQMRRLLDAREEVMA